MTSGKSAAANHSTIPATSPGTIVSTDLDGTLLDHYSYSWKAAQESIERLKAESIPIVINTSKTFSEVEALQKELALDAPFVVENGSAIYFPKGAVNHADVSTSCDEFDCCILGKLRSDILAVLENLKASMGFEFEGFNDWSVDQVIAHTGLSAESAQLARIREFSEPILWFDADSRFFEFSKKIAAAGLRIIRGGRFIHILGQADKGAAVNKLVSLLFNGGPSRIICLGDSYNDLDMLKIADIPVFIKSPVHDFPECDLSGTPGEKNAIYTSVFGPEGWREAMSQILQNND